MALASDLMGLGVAPLQAARTATGGIGPVTLTPAGTTFSGSTKLGCTQFVVTTNPLTGAQAVGLPTIGSDAGAFIADGYVINNAGTTSLFIFASTGILISGQTSNSSKQQIQAHQTATLYAISSSTSATTNWVMVAGS